MKCFIQSINVDPIIIHYWTENGVRLWHELVAISVDHIIIHYWTENGVRLWHELVATKVVFLDATG